MLKSKKISASSLIELILTIVIILIILGISLPNANLVERHRENIEIKNFTKSIKETRLYSIKERKRHKITFDLINNNYWDTKNKETIQLNYLKYNKKMTNIDHVEFTIKGIPAYESAGTIILNGKYRDFKVTIQPVTGKTNCWEVENEI